MKMLCLYNIREGILMIGEFLISIRKACLIKPISGWIRTLQTIQRMIDRETFFKGIEETIKTPFRVVPFFDPAPWGRTMVERSVWIKS